MAKFFNTGNQFSVGNTSYDTRRVLVIAELGSSHGADPVKARELIDAAAEAGADCVKLQLIYADEILHPNTGEVPLPGGRRRLYDTFRELEREPDFYAGLKTYAESRGLLFLCTPFGPKSAAELAALQPLFVKVASPELNYSGLLRQIASYGLPTLLSTGVSKLGDIEEALGYFSPGQVCLLHCVTAYPAPEEDYNLRVLGSLGAVFGVPLGVSDHSGDPELVPALAVAMGTVAVEKHFCLSRNDPGLDDPIALPPGDFRRMVEVIRWASVTEAGEPGQVIAAMARERGKTLVEAVLGDGIKRLAPSEAANYERTNRSLHALRDIRKGETIGADMFRALRTEKVLRPGLPPSWEAKIAGRKAGRFIPAGEGIRFEDL
ncbi:MAG: N-acetylneuraminate synthase family protein [Spirochaetaceae bacterium]|jgi:sialic acid synthase SpsE|nr:N-acetylneuraminate synthase family protein [Spirochaetaceae bacterium]